MGLAAYRCLMPLRLTKRLKSCGGLSGPSFQSFRKFKSGGDRVALKRSTVLIFSLFSTSLAHAASAQEVDFTCDYQLGTEVDAQRRKIGSVAIAIDVKAKTARIDFGKGWFKTITLQVDGTDVKETAPPISGEELGFFYFDLSENSGGFSGGAGEHEFFDACVQNKSAANVAAVSHQDIAEPPTINSDHKKQAIEVPAPAPEVPSPPQIFGQGTTEYYGGMESRAKSALPTEATINPDYKKEEDRAATTPAAAKEPSPTPTFGQGTTEYFGGYSSPPARSTEIAG